MTRLPLTFACGPYDRTRALADGRVGIEGVDLRYVCLDPEEIFFRMVRHGEFDASEMSLSTYLLSFLNDGPFVAVPVFPSRSFRHSGIYVSATSGLAGGPVSALAGSSVGIAEYQLTANVWIRGILQEHYGVAASSVSYRVGGLHQPGRPEKFHVSLPPEIDIAPAPSGRTLSDLLATGELDAVYSPRAPDSLESGDAHRLFADPRAEERRYFAQTGIFPIMHVLVLHRRVYETNPWVAQELLKACVRAKEIAYAELMRTVSLSLTLPWVREEYEQTVAILGDDYWSYGLEQNRSVLTTFIRYAAEQGLVERQVAPEELFAPETTESYVI
ncbi:ABC transporter substrate-binding protein [Actinomadura coerulea]|uniref:ABC transporter substrate-binding protein n=1 Tax=Actinomadura coerulea TaxID=46159 RepID=UPI00342A8097